MSIELATNPATAPNAPATGNAAAAGAAVRTAVAAAIASAQNRVSDTASAIGTEWGVRPLVLTHLAAVCSCLVLGLVCCALCRCRARRRRKEADVAAALAVYNNELDDEDAIALRQSKYFCHVAQAEKSSLLGGGSDREFYE